jgi:hypothetical protein
MKKILLIVGIVFVGILVLLLVNEFLLKKNAALNGDGIIILKSESAKVHILNVPEYWYLKKEGDPLSAKYTVADGLLSVKKLKNGKGLLFRKGQSQNIYEWDRQTNNLIERTIEDWDEATDERNEFYENNLDITILPTENDVISLLNEDYKFPEENKILNGKITSKYLQIISFTGKTEEGKSIMPFLGGGPQYTGEIFLQIYSKNEKKLIVSLKQTVEKNGLPQFFENFWHDESTLIVFSIINPDTIVIIDLES